MAKRGRPPKPQTAIEKLIEEHLNDIERKELNRLACLYVKIFTAAYKNIHDFNANEEEKDCIIKAAEDALEKAAKEVFSNLKNKGIKISANGIGRPKSLDAVLRICFVDHLTRQEKSKDEAFNMLSDHIAKIPPEFGISYPVSFSTNLNHWRKYQKQQRDIAIIQYFQASLIVWIKDQRP